MKLVVQIPVYNEEKHLPIVIRDIQKNFAAMPGVKVEILIIDDGSSDLSCEMARKAGVTEIVMLGTHQGLGVAFREGLRRALELEADIIVNTDADFQYNADQINTLIAPLLDNPRRVNMVIGDRQITKLPAYPLYKLFFQSIGNFLVGSLMHCRVKDSTSGFRAFSRETAEWLVARLKNQYTYTLESICLLLKHSKPIIFVPIRINPSLRKSRLIKHKLVYIGNYLLTLIRLS